MKRNTILAALTAVSLSAAVTPVGAQQLLPQPKQAVFGKGTFNPQKGVILMEETPGAGHGKEYYRLHITPDTMRVGLCRLHGPLLCHTDHQPAPQGRPAARL